MQPFPGSQKNGKLSNTGGAGWKPAKVLQMNGETVAGELSAEHQIITESWDRVVAMPYIVYMPERKELLMLVAVDYRYTTSGKLDSGNFHMGALMRSRDFGATWTEPEFIRTDSSGDYKLGMGGMGTGLTYLGEGKLLLYTGSFRWFSLDYGKVWGDAVPLQPASGEKGWNAWDPALVERDSATGEIKRLAETGWFGKDGRSQGFIRFSPDCGLTWSNDIRVPQWHGIGEVALCRAGNNTLVAACRTDNPEQYRNENDEYSGLVISLSKDDGYTWTEVKVLYDYGRHHPCMVLLPGGDIVMTYVVRVGYPHDENGFSQFGIEAVVSRDHGESWDLEHRYILEKWKGNRTEDTPEWPRWYASSQSTSTVLLPDGFLLTAFGTGYRSRPGQGHFAPRDVGLIRWQK